MKKALIRALIGGDGTDYRRESGWSWFKEAFASAAGFFGPIIVGCFLMQVARWMGFI